MDNPGNRSLSRKKISLANLKNEKSRIAIPTTPKNINKQNETNYNTNSDNYEWIFDIYIPNLLDIVEDHKKQMSQNKLSDEVIDEYLQKYINLENYIMEGIKFSDTKKITSEKIKNYLIKFKNVWNEHKARWPNNYKTKYNKYIEGFPYLSKIFTYEDSKSGNESLSITNDKESLVEGQVSRISLFNKDDSRLYTERSFHDKSFREKSPNRSQSIHTYLETKNSIKKNYNSDYEILSNGNDKVSVSNDKSGNKGPTTLQLLNPHKSCCECLIF